MYFIMGSFFSYQRYFSFLTFLHSRARSSSSSGMPSFVCVFFLRQYGSFSFVSAFMATCSASMVFFFIYFICSSSPNLPNLENPKSPISNPFRCRNTLSSTHRTPSRWWAWPPEVELREASLYCVNNNLLTLEHGFSSGVVFCHLRYYYFSLIFFEFFTIYVHLVSAII